MIAKFDCCMKHGQHLPWHMPKGPLMYILLSSIFSTIISVASYSQQWQVLGSESQVAQAASSFTSIAARQENGDAAPYIIFIEGGAVKVKKLAGGTWQQVGSAVHTGSSTYCRLYASPAGNLIATYVDGTAGNRLAVRQYNSAGQSWEPLNNEAGNLYVSDASVTYSISQFSSTPRSGLAFDNNGTPYVVFSDGAGFNPFVKRFVGNAWETVGGSAVSADRAAGVNIAIDSTDNSPWVVYLQQSTAGSTTGPIRVYRLASGAWENVAVPNPINGGSSTTGATTGLRHTCIAFTSNWSPVVAYFNTSSNNRATTAIFNKATSTWNFSAALSARDAPAISLVRDARGNVFCSFTDAVTNGSGRTLARVFMLPAGTTSWGELRNSDLVTGVDEPAGNLTLAPGFGGRNPFIVYTKSNTASIVTPIVQVFATEEPNGNDDPVTTPKQMEKLNRGLVAIRTTPSQVYVGWRLLGTDTSIMAFNVYRNGAKLNTTPITSSTNYLDNTSENGTYTVRPVVSGEELDASESATTWQQAYLDVNLQKPADGATPLGDAYSYSPNDCSVGDVDGDGEYEIFVKWEPSNAKDNSQAGYTGNVYIDCYKLNGTRLWRVDLGRNIRAGAHYTQFMVYDYDGDGKAEMACKTADGTMDGTGTLIGDANADYRNSDGYVLTGPEFLTMFNGLTGAAMATVDYLPARGSVSSWGDSYGNRVDRFVAGVAYLDGQQPSLIMGRGYYTRLVRVAWNWRDGKFTRRWTFDSNQPGNGTYVGQGNHNISVGDMDGDGKQEFLNGSSAQNNNGTGLWTNGLGHADALHLTDIDPDRPGLEFWQPYESPGSNGNIGAALVDAKTGQSIFTVAEASADVGRAMASDIDPRHKGVEVWAARGDLYTAKGQSLGATKPSMNFAIWWDADTTRELLDGNTITKWNWNNSTNPAIFTATGCLSNNSTKATPNLSADLLGDWREEVIFRTEDNTKLRIFTTTAFAENRFYTLMHDPQYRVAIAWQNTSYNQPPHPGFYLGAGMDAQPKANIYYAGPGTSLPLQWLHFDATNEGKEVLLQWSTGREQNVHHFAIERSANGRLFTTLGTLLAKVSQPAAFYRYHDAQPFTGTGFYRIRQVDNDGKYSYSAIRSVQRKGKQHAMAVYPNPALRGQKVALMVENATTAKLQAQLTTADGKMLSTLLGTVTEINEQLNAQLGKQSAGMYYLRMMVNGAIQTATIVVR